MANQDFRRMTPGVVQDDLEKRIYKLEHGGAGAPTTFRRPITFAPEPEANPGVTIKAVTLPAIQIHDVFNVFLPDGETVIFQIKNDGSIQTTGRINSAAPHFLINKTGTQNVGWGDQPKVQFNSDEFDSHSAFDLVNNWFTVPTGWGGLWSLSAGVKINQEAQAGRIVVDLVSEVDPSDPESPGFVVLRGEGIAYKTASTQTMSANTPAIPARLVDGERVIVRIQNLIGPDVDNETVTISTDLSTFFAGFWIRD